MKINLRAPIQKDGACISCLELNLDNLSGEDIIAATQEARLRGDTTPNPLFSALGLAVIAAKATNQRVDDIIELRAPDFIQLTTLVSNFLFEGALAAMMPSNTTAEPS